MAAQCQCGPVVKAPAGGVRWPVPHLASQVVLFFFKKKGVVALPLLLCCKLNIGTVETDRLCICWIWISLFTILFIGYGYIYL